MIDGLKMTISNCRGTDYRENMFTVSVGEAAKRFTAEQVDNGEAMEWAEAVVAYIREMAARGASR